VARGREVYRQEACITCHSQYIRPLTHDVEMWGPFRAPDFHEAPALHRQPPPGPRSHECRPAPQRGVAAAPPRESAGPVARLPHAAYAHLFADGSTRGDDLVAYLGSLGRGHEMERLSFIRACTPPALEHPADAARGARVFQVHCMPCHGPEGRGDGPEAALFARPALNLRKGMFWYTGQGLTAEHLHTELSRIVRFGVYGTSMAGHETFTDRQVADVAAYVQQLTAQDKL
jgi:mono/diheme cytochrome c family protein